MKDKWGLVLPPTYVIEKDLNRAVYWTGGPLSEHELRASILFWDELNYPVVEHTNLQISTDFEFLIQSGVMKRLKVDTKPGRLATMLQRGYLTAFRTLDNLEPGKWSVGFGSNALPLPASALAKGRGILLSLQEAIPIPDKSVPLQDILEFRQKYRDELLAFRYYLYSI